MLKINLEHIWPFLEEAELQKLKPEILKSQKILSERNGPGSDFLGWLDLPESLSSQLIDKILEVSGKLQEKIDSLVIVGIGGSYLGARAVLESIHGPFRKSDSSHPEVLYAGHHISQDYLTELLQYLDDKSYALVVISKSGTTTEPAIAFRLIKDHIIMKYGQKEAGERIIVITDEKKGALRSLANTEGYTSFIIPDDVGGRFSVLSPVGLLPLAMGGVNIRELLEGALEIKKHSETEPYESNPVSLYVALRNIFYRMGKVIEVLVNYNPGLHYFSEWWKQLYGESEGKEGKGLYPSSVNFTTDLHSMGQYLQEGKRILFETTLSPRFDKHKVTIPEQERDLDDLNYLAGKEIGMVNRMAQLGTILAHVEGGVPNIIIEFERIEERSLGQLIYFFEKSCAISGYTLGINPFDQPGVEAYKRNMFALLEKPGYEEATKIIKSKLR